MNEFKVNGYITLKLEEGKTFIHIAGKKFMQCIRLMLNIPKDSSFSGLTHLIQQAQLIEF